MVRPAELGTFDWPLFMALLTTCAMSLLTISSATFQNPDLSGLASRQAFWICAGLVALLVMLAIDYHTTRFEDVLKDIDVVLDALGTTQRDLAMNVLKSGGRLASIRGTMPESTKKYGPILGIVPTFWDMASFLVRGRLRGLHPAVVLKQCDGEQLGQITALIEAGTIKPVIDRVLPMAEAAEAHRYLETGRARGKVVLAGWSSNAAGRG